MSATRIERRFAELRAEGRAGLVTFVTAGDPDPDTGREILAGLPGAGADFIEIGMPFSDPMADGPAIQAASLRALSRGMTLRKVLDMVAEFRTSNGDTPIVLMGYYNPIYRFGVERFLNEAKTAGVDGLIIVDLPPEENDELAIPARKAGINFIFLTAPTTSETRLPKVLEQASGFIYYVSITGVTGTRSADMSEVGASVARLRDATDLPVAIGFGIKTPDQAAEFARIGDAAVVGSALIAKIEENLDENGEAGTNTVPAVLDLTRDLAQGVRGARKETV